MVFLSGIQAAWREVKPIFVGLLGGWLLALLTRQKLLLGAATLLLGGVCYFFRDPERDPDTSDSLAILAPADGKVTAIEVVDEPYLFQGPARRISVFLSLPDVHVQRTPYQGRVTLLHYQPGDFAPAFLKDTHSNEFNFIGLTTPHGPLGVKQIAGILARRIVCWADLDTPLARGQRLGLVKFGSRVDLYLPLEAEVYVEVGQQTYGGQTVVGRWVEG
jgi:phosphatidylserine decarboxylase